MPDSFSHLPHSSDTVSQEPKVYDFSFTGSGFEYFRIWIVNIFLSIITLGIYSAWAKVRTKRYFYGNTHLNGSSFDYTANPLQILKGRFIALGLLIAYQWVAHTQPHLAGFALIVFVLIVPVLIVLSMRFRMRNTVWRGIRFDFKANFKSVYLLFLPPFIYVVAVALVPFFLDIDVAALQNEATVMGEMAEGLATFMQIMGVLVLTATLLFPWWQKKYYDFIGSNSRFGLSEFGLKTTVGGFYFIYFIAALILLGIGGSGGVIIAAILPTYVSGDLNMVFISSAIFLLVLMSYTAAIVYVMTKKTNLLYGKLSLDNDSVCFQSNLSVPYMMYLYITNTLAILFTFTLAIPWAMVRTAKYRASKTAALSSDLDAFIAEKSEAATALGEEVGEMFDLDIGV